MKKSYLFSRDLSNRPLRLLFQVLSQGIWETMPGTPPGCELWLQRPPHDTQKVASVIYICMIFFLWNGTTSIWIYSATGLTMSGTFDEKSIILVRSLLIFNLSQIDWSVALKLTTLRTRPRRLKHRYLCWDLENSLVLIGSHGLEFGLLHDSRDNSTKKKQSQMKVQLL